jgi:hypothetical protein
VNEIAIAGDYVSAGHGEPAALFTIRNRQFTLTA